MKNVKKFVKNQKLILLDYYLHKAFQTYLQCIQHQMYDCILINHFSCNLQRCVDVFDSMHEITYEPHITI
jgi:hypothetical protein